MVAMGIKFKNLIEEERVQRRIITKRRKVGHKIRKFHWPMLIEFVQFTQKY